MTSARSGEWVLVTGFGPFPGVPVNPTQALAEALHGRTFEGLTVVARVLDVAFERSAAQLREAVSEGWPRALIHFGVAQDARRVRVEARAVNRIASNTPDVDGQRFTAAPVLAGRTPDVALATRVATDDLAASLDAAALPARVSDDAGRYVCNALYCHSLALVDDAGLDVPSLFVHVPPTGIHGWTEARLREAAHHVVGWVASRS